MNMLLAALMALQGVISVTPVLADQDAPAVSIIDPRANRRSFRDNSVDVRAVISDNSGIVKAELWVVGFPQPVDVKQWSSPSLPRIINLNWSASEIYNGNYTLRVVGCDLAKNCSQDEIVVTRTGGRAAINQAPVVTLTQLLVFVPPAVTLEAHVVDDDYPIGSVLTNTWSQISGPGVATFDSPAEDVMIVTLPIPGTYVVRLTSSDGALSGFADLTITQP